LHDQCAIEPREPRATLILRHVDGGHAERRRLLDHIDGKICLLVPFGGVGSDALPCKGECRLLDGGLFFGKRNVHGGSAPTAGSLKKQVIPRLGRARDQSLLPRPAPWAAAGAEGGK